jgi:hypothetical protein
MVIPQVILISYKIQLRRFLYFAAIMHYLSDI